MFNLFVSTGRYAQFLGALLLFVLAGQTQANQCLALLPGNTVADGLPQLCQSDYNGDNSTYSCQDYRSANQRYRVLYKGGSSARAVLQLHHDATTSLVAASQPGHKLNCPLPPPVAIPEHATHLGTGVCHDDSNQLVACSVYEHAEARQLDIHRYMVFYQMAENGEASLAIDVQPSGKNEDAMVAELAFQMGMSLWDSNCCAKQAADYIAYAYQLFPHADDYREAYQLSRATLASTELDSRQ